MNSIQPAVMDTRRFHRTIRGASTERYTALPPDDTRRFHRTIRGASTGRYAALPPDDTRRLHRTIHKAGWLGIIKPAE